MSSPVSIGVLQEFLIRTRSSAYDPGYGILQPGEIELIHCLGELNDVLDVETAVMVRGDGDIPPHPLANRGAVILDRPQTLLGDLTAGELVGGPGHPRQTGRASSAPA